MAQALPVALPQFSHIHRYWDDQFKIAAAKIMPGECYVSNKGEMITTLLGSCIAVCIRDIHLGIGGMNHFMLPEQTSNPRNIRHGGNPELCYGNFATDYLLDAIYKLGGIHKNLEVKIFGGGRVLSGMSHLDVGRANIDFIVQYLRRHRLKIVAQDVGDVCPRKIMYFSATGVVKLKRLSNAAFELIQPLGKTYSNKLASNGDDYNEPDRHK